MSGADRPTDVDELREIIDCIDVCLRELVRERTEIARQIVEMKRAPTDHDREEEILEQCESDAERDIFRRLFRASKQAAVRDTFDGRS